MRAAVVGAGVSGLAAGRELVRRGVETVVFEAARQVGGRVCTHIGQGYIADFGAQFITPRGMRVEQALLHDLPSHDLVEILRPIYIYDGGRAVVGSSDKNSQNRFTYRGGLRRFCELLADGLDVRTSTPVSELGQSENGLLVNGGCFDAVILTGPLPEMEPILRSHNDRRASLAISYRSCISVSVGFRGAALELPYFGLLSAERRTPVLWLGIENLKCEDRAPEGCTLITAQFGPDYSDDNLDQPTERLIATVLALTQNLYGVEFGTPDWSFVHSWRRSQPERVAMFESINPEGSRIVIAGDGTIAGRIENAYESGLLAAEHVCRLAG